MFAFISIPVCYILLSLPITLKYSFISLKTFFNSISIYKKRKNNLLRKTLEDANKTLEEEKPYSRDNKRLEVLDKANEVKELITKLPESVQPIYTSELYKRLYYYSVIVQNSIRGNNILMLENEDSELIKLEVFLDDLITRVKLRINDEVHLDKIDEILDEYDDSLEEVQVLRRKVKKK